MWALETWVDEALYDYENGLDWGIRPLSQVVPTALGGDSSAFLDDVATRGLPDVARLPVRGDLPALHVGGWWDIVQRGQVATWHEASERRRAPQFLVMDATDHGWTHLRGPEQRYVDPRPTRRPCGSSSIITWARSSRSCTISSPVRAQRTHRRCGGCWPMTPGTSATAAREQRAGGLVRTRTTTRVAECSIPAADSAERARVVDARPAGPRAEPRARVPPLIEPADETSSGHRDDILVYESEPMPQPLDLAGPASLTMVLTSGAESTHLMASVSDLSPDGSALKILDGAAHVDGPWPREVTVELGSTGYRLRPGHRLRLAFSSSEFPRYLLHPGTTADPWTAQDSRPTEQQTILGGARAARLRCFALRPRGGCA